MAENSYSRLRSLVQMALVRLSPFKVAMHDVVAYELQGRIAGIFMVTDVQFATCGS